MTRPSSRARYVAWTLSWLAYATYYTGRKGFGVAKAALARELGVGVALLGAVDTVYLTAYAVGQFSSGVLGDRVGARRLVGFGMLAAAGCCAAFGASRLPSLLVLFFGLNGLAQATGWPGTTRAMSEWTTPQNRGTVMAFWATCYQVGGIVASLLAGWLLVRYGWRSVFFAPAALLAAVGVLVLVALPLGPTVEARAVSERPPGPLSAAPQAIERAPLDRRLWFYGASYFFIKFIRYALLFWLPYYFVKQLAYAEDDAAYVSTAFEAGGTLGVIAIGIASDRIPGRSRAFVAMMSLFALATILYLYSLFAGASVIMNVIILGLVGAALFGPDALISGAIAQDAGGAARAATATGFVNGVGSIGAMLEGLVVPWLAREFGWGALFPVLVGMGVFAALALVPTLGRRAEA